MPLNKKANPKEKVLVREEGYADSLREHEQIYYNWFP